MPINASYEYLEAEKKYLQAEGLENKISALEDMIRKMPTHKSAENLRAELRTRLKKLKGKLEKGKKIGKGGKRGVRKEGYQVALVGKANSGKSSLLGALSNAKPFVSEVEFSTKTPEVGMMDYGGVKVQVVDLPSVGGKEFDIGIVNNADCLLLVIESLEDLKDVESVLEKSIGKRIVVVNKIDLLNENEKRKVGERCKGKRIKDFVLVSSINGEGIEGLKEKIFEGMGVIRVYMKEPGKPASPKPAVLSVGSSVKDVAESIYKGFSRTVKETRLTGPSGKFSNQKVGMKHKVKDKDVVEFHTR